MADPLFAHLSHRPWVTHRADSGADVSVASLIVLPKAALPSLGKALDPKRPWKVIVDKCDWVVATRPER